MTAALTQPVTFEEYLKFQATQDLTYELHRGELVPVPVGRSPHGKIARFLEDTFRAEMQRLGLALETSPFKVSCSLLSCHVIDL